MAYATCDELQLFAPESEECSSNCNSGEPSSNSRGHVMPSGPRQDQGIKVSQLPQQQQFRIRGLYPGPPDLATIYWLPFATAPEWTKSVASAESEPCLESGSHKDRE
eukprot:CAMPEP_0181332008 /NCGR_PEP_ID=MMETSP1101-20121128/24838_1 /TAXON_ID=46948 /ORGANISM="Rhodomonas abbreviata, Strain Caron Lab Isolate" /LENGTH=106 /DNA_ID=CAMNT_0023441571 /DNA_START=466 /DNA_END=786 /DNA_ORIENTATION=-